MTHTLARKRFKAKFGQQNHFLITCLVGLSYVERSEVALPEGFSTSWNPRDKAQSARRSRDFILGSFLAHAVDGMDMYLSLLNRKPKPFIRHEISEVYDSAGRSVYKKVEGIGRVLDIPKLNTALCILIITIRNNKMHEMADNEFPEEYEILLREKKDEVEERYSGLEIVTLLSKRNGIEDVTFKEVASLIHATHEYIEMVDQKILAEIQPNFQFEALLYYLKNEKKLRDKYLRIGEHERSIMIRNLLQNRLGIPFGEVEVSIDMLDLNIERINCA